MLIAFLTGLLLGFVICIPVGPINIYALNTMLKHSMREGLLVALGASILDFFYFFMIWSGLSFVHLGAQSSFKVKVIGLCLLFGYGVFELYKGLKLKPTDMLQNEPEIKNKWFSHLPSRHFFYLSTGALLYISNPTLVATMTALASFIKSLHLFSMNSGNYAAISLGVSFGTFLWFVFFLGTVKKYREFIPPSFYRYLSITSGALVLILVASFAYKML